MTNTANWDSLAAGIADAEVQTSVVEYGVGMPDETDLRLIGNPADKRVLDLGCGAGQSAITLVRQGAHVIAIDASEAMLAVAAKRADALDVTVEWHAGDLADLAFLRAESIDAALAIDSLDEVEDIDRVFRQVHRVLRPSAPFVFTLDHPMRAALGSAALSRGAGLPLGDLVVESSYYQGGPTTIASGSSRLVVHPRTVETIFAGLHRAGYQVDQILEPEPRVSTPGPAVPSKIIWRARKLGS